MIFNSIYPYICKKNFSPLSPNYPNMLWVKFNFNWPSCSQGKKNFSVLEVFKKNIYRFFNEGEIIYYLEGEYSP